MPAFLANILNYLFLNSVIGLNAASVYMYEHLHNSVALCCYTVTKFSVGLFRVEGCLFHYWYWYRPLEFRLLWCFFNGFGIWITYLCMFSAKHLMIVRCMWFCLVD